jgi:hypothetical protein
MTGLWREGARGRFVIECIAQLLLTARRKERQRVRPPRNRLDRGGVPARVHDPDLPAGCGPARPADEVIE